MKRISSGFDRIAIIVILMAGLLVLATAVQPWVDPRWLYLDTQTVGELSGDCCHIYDGAISTLGIMIWAATAAILLFTAWVGYGLRQKDLTNTTLQGAVVSTLLALDDAYLFHEIVFPKLGVPQVVIIAIYTGIMAAYLVWNFQFFKTKSSWILAVSLAAFAASVGIDQIAHSIKPVWVVLEDGAKFVGIVSWFLFHFSLFSDSVVRAQVVSKT
ncbi:MAG: hypothetical protein ACE37M_13635 [Henriciella sp.]